MKRPVFTEGVIVALAVSLFASFMYAVLAWFLSATGILQLVISFSGLLYVIYLVARSTEKSGRIVVVSGWILIAGFIWLADIPLALFCLVHAVMIWLIRSLYFYSSLLSSILDSALIISGLILSTWAFYQTNSLFMSLWSFFLVQALFTIIPVRRDAVTFDSISVINNNDGFDLALKNANEALKRLSMNRT